MIISIGTPYTHQCGNLDMWTGGENNRHVQADMQTCTHCQKAINLQADRDKVSFCTHCQALVCLTGPCAEQTAQFGCIPYLKKVNLYLEQMIRRQALVRALGLDPGVPSGYVKIGDHLIRM